MQPSYQIVDEYCFKHNLSIRNHGIIHKARTTDSIVFFGTHKNQVELMNWLNNMEDNKIYEILFHPGRFDALVKSSLNIDREKDIENILFLNNYIANKKIAKLTYNELRSLRI